MWRLALVLVLASGCVPRGLVAEARDRDRDGHDAWQLGGDDCDDAAPAVHPGADEACGNDRDDDCDGDVDEDGLGASTWYQDVDRDGYGATDRPRAACAQPPGFAAVGGDCDDAITAVNPGADEVCGNGRDDDCDGATDDAGVGATAWYRDADGDGHGDLDDRVEACEAPQGYVASADDCDDGAAVVHPGATEVCNNGVDDNCDASASPCELRGVIGLGTADVRIRGSEAELLFGRSLAAWPHEGGATLAVGAGHVFLADYTPGRVFLGPIASPPPTGPAQLGSTLQPPAQIDVMRATGHALVACDLDADTSAELVVFDASYVPGTIGGIATYSSSAINVLDTPVTTSWPAPVARITSTDAAGYPGGGTGRRLLCGDLDGDGKPDLVAGRAGDTGALAFRGPLTGVLDGDDATWTVSGGYPLDTGDVDADGRDELLVASSDGTVDIWGLGPAGDWRVETSLTAPALGWSGGFGDFDGDDVADVALVEQTGIASAGRVLVFLHTTLVGTTGLTADDADSEIMGSSTVNLRSVGSPGDLDLDGDEELCVVSPSDDTLGANTGAVYCFAHVASSPSWEIDQADLVLVGEAAGSAQGPSDPHRDARILHDVDVDGDGVLDLVLGWPYNDAGAADAGAVFVLYGLAL